MFIYGVSCGCLYVSVYVSGGLRSLDKDGTLLGRERDHRSWAVSRAGESSWPARTERPVWEGCLISPRSWTDIPSDCMVKVTVCYCMCKDCGCLCQHYKSLPGGHERRVRCEVAQAAALLRTHLCSVWSLCVCGVMSRPPCVMCTVCWVNWLKWTVCLLCPPFWTAIGALRYTCPSQLCMSRHLPCPALLCICDLCTCGLKCVEGREGVKGGNVTISFTKAASSNQVVLLFGDTQGIIRINSNRQIYSDIWA